MSGSCLEQFRSACSAVDRAFSLPSEHASADEEMASAVTLVVSSSAECVERLDGAVACSESDGGNNLANLLSSFGAKAVTRGCKLSAEALADEIVVEAVSRLTQAYLRAFVSLLRYAAHVLSGDVCKALHLIFAPSTLVNKLVGHDNVRENLRQQEWRKQLAWADKVDAIFQDKGEKRWRKAQVVMEDVPGPNGEKLLQLHFEGELEGDERNDITLSRFSRDIAPLGSMTDKRGQPTTDGAMKHNDKPKVPDDFYKTLKAGQQVDAIDHNQKWYNATVLHTFDLKKKGTVRITYRIYHPTGIYEDEAAAEVVAAAKGGQRRSGPLNPLHQKLGKKFYGFKSDCDEDHRLVPEEIQPLGYMADNILKQIAAKDDYQRVDDTSDPDLLCAVYRGLEGEGGRGLVENINYFGSPQLDGFNTLHSFLDARAHAAVSDLDALTSLHSAICAPARLYTKTFANDFGVRFTNAIHEVASSLPDSRVKIMNSQELGKLVHTSYQLLRRSLDKHATAEVIETFSLNFAYRCFKNDQYMVTRLEGFKHILSLIASVSSQNAKTKTYHLDSPTLLTWISSERIVETVFNPSFTNREIVQRSPALLRLLVKRKMLEDMDVRSLVKLMQSQDQDLALTACTALKQVVEKEAMSADHCRTIVRAFKDVEGATFREESIAMLIEVGRRCTILPITTESKSEVPISGSEYLNPRKISIEVLDIMWDVWLGKRGPISPDIDTRVYLAMTRDLLFYSYYLRGENMQFLRRCLSLIQSGHHVPKMLKMMRDVIGQFKKKDIETAEVRSEKLAMDVVSTTAKVTATTNTTGSGTVVTDAVVLTSVADSSKLSVPVATATVTATAVPDDGENDFPFQQDAIERLVDLNLFHFIIVSAKASQKRVSDMLLNGKLSGEDIHTKSLEFEDGFTYIQCLKAKLRFLYFAVKSSQKVTLNFEYTHTLWNFLYERSSIERERDALCEWLTELVQSQSLEGRKCFNVGVIPRIFGEMISTVTSPSRAGFKCFQACFLSANSDIDNIKMRSAGSFVVCKLPIELNDGNSISIEGSSKYQRVTEDVGGSVTNFGLIGLGSLWNVALRVEDDAVAALAIDLLNLIHSQLCDDLLPQLASLRHAFIAHTMTYMRDAVTRLGLRDSHRGGPSVVANYSRPVRRCVNLLRDLLHSSESSPDFKGYGSLRPHGQKNRGRGKMITISCRCPANKNTRLSSRFKIRVLSTATLWEVRARIAQEAGENFSVQRIGLIRAGERIGSAFNSKMLGPDLGFCDGMDLMVSKKPKTTVVGERKSSQVESKSSSVSCPLDKSLVLNENNQLTSRVLEVFKEIFYRFASTDGMMTRQHVSKWLSIGLNEPMNRVDYAVNEFMRGNDGRQTQCMLLDDFNSTLRIYARTDIAKVWTVLDNCGYTENLFSKAEADDQNERENTLAAEESQNHEKAITGDVVKCESKLKINEQMGTTCENELAREHELPRYILANGNKYFESFFILLNGFQQAGLNDVADSIWELLMHLPTNQHLERQIRELPNRNLETNEIEWDSLFNSERMYKLLYSMQLLENLLNDSLSTSVKVGNNESIAIQNVSNRKESWDTKVAGSVEQNPEEANDATTNQGPAQELSSIAKNLDSNIPILEISRPESISMTPAESERWRQCFLSFGGFEHIYEILVSDKLGTGALLRTTAGQQVVGLLLKIIRNFLLDALAVDAPSVHSALEGIQNSSLDSFLARKSTSVPNNSENTEANSSSILMSRRRSSSIVSQIVSVKVAKEILGKVNFTALHDSFMLILKEVTRMPAFKNGDPLSISADQQMCKVDSERMESIIAPALSGWVGILVHKRELLARFLLDPTSPSIVVHVLHYQKSATVRSMCARAFFQLSLLDLDASKYFFRILRKAIPKAQGLPGATCSEHFELMSRIIAETTSYRREELSTILHDLIIIIVNTTPSSSKENHKISITSELSSDEGYRGILRIIMTILLQSKPSFQDQATKAGLMRELTSRSLIVVPQSEGKSMNERPKCQSKQTRTAAFDTLLALCKDHAHNQEELMASWLVPLSGHMRKPEKFGFSPKRDARSPSGFVGLKNLGNICYLNSVVQQFYHIPDIRKGILTAKIPSLSITSREASKDHNEEAEQKVSQKDASDDFRLLAEVQRMFANLALSDRQYFVPDRVCRSFLDSSGKPVDISIQKDATEFFGDFFDKLDNAFKRLERENHSSSKKANILDRFRGTTVTQIMYGNQRRENQQEFLNVPLTVKNTRTMAESFEKMKEADKLSGFDWDEKTRNIEARKRSLLGKLPQTMVVQCNRFVFNFDTFQQQKLNTRFEFDRYLNVEPHTKEGMDWREWDDKYGQKSVPKDSISREAKTSEGKTKETKSGQDALEGHSDNDVDVPPRPPGQYQIHPRSYYEYDLVGIVVHSGNAQAGHYYSFICDQYNIEEEKKTWFRFDDQTVEKWDIDSCLEKDTFGGEIESASMNSTGSYTLQSQESIRNAYLLFYERRFKGRTSKSEEKGEEFSQNLDFADEKIVASGPQSTMPQILRNQVLEDNERFAFDLHIFDTCFFHFVSKLYSQLRCTSSTELKDQALQDAHLEQRSSTNDTNLKYLKWGVKILMNVVSRADHYDGTVEELCLTLGGMISESKFAAEWFLKYLAEHPKDLKDLLLTCVEYHVRYNFALLVKNALTLLSHETTEYSIIAGTKISMENPAGPAVDEPIDIPSVSIPSLESTELPSQNISATSINGVVCSFISILVNLMADAATYWHRFDEYFSVILTFAKASRANAVYLGSTEIRLAGKLADFFLQEDSPLSEDNALVKPRRKMGNSMAQPNFKMVLAALAEVVVASPNAAGFLPPACARSFVLREGRRLQLIDMGLAADPSGLTPESIADCKQAAARATVAGNKGGYGGKKPMDDVTKSLLLSLKFWSKAMNSLSQGKSSIISSLSEILHHLCWGDPAFSNWAATHLVREADKNVANLDKLPTFHQLLEAVICVPDTHPEGGSLQQVRIRNILGTTWYERQKAQYELSRDADMVLKSRDAEGKENYAMKVTESSVSNNNQIDVLNEVARETKEARRETLNNNQQSHESKEKFKADYVAKLSDSDKFAMKSMLLQCIHKHHKSHPQWAYSCLRFIIRVMCCTRPVHKYISGLNVKDTNGNFPLDRRFSDYFYRLLMSKSFQRLPESSQVKEAIRELEEYEIKYYGAARVAKDILDSNTQDEEFSRIDYSSKDANDASLLTAVEYFSKYKPVRRRRPNHKDRDQGIVCEVYFCEDALNAENMYHVAFLFKNTNDRPVNINFEFLPDGSEVHETLTAASLKGRIVEPEGVLEMCCLPRRLFVSKWDPICRYKWTFTYVSQHDGNASSSPSSFTEARVISPLEQSENLQNIPVAVVGPQLPKGQRTENIDNAVNSVEDMNLQSIVRADPKKVSQLVDMGLGSRGKCEQALVAYANNLESAVNHLLGSM